MARGWNRFKVGPWSTKHDVTNNSSLSICILFSAFAAADLTDLVTTSEALLGTYLKIARASFTFLPRIRSTTWRTLRGDNLTYLTMALASTGFTSHFGDGPCVVGRMIII